MILAFSPVYRLEPETVEAVHGQTYGGLWHWLLGYANPHSLNVDKRGVQNTLFQYNVGRDVFLRGDWDWWWIVESDIIPPLNALERMLEIAERRSAEVVRLPYLYRQPWPNQICALGEHYSHTARNRGEPIKPEFWTAGEMLCSGGGLGCTLVRRDVVEAVPFRHGGRAHCDTYWNDDVWHAGYTEQWTDMQMWCGHKAPSGEILWPKLGSPSPA